MKAVVFHGSPRKGNTYTATKLFIEELSRCGEMSFTEFSLPKDVPEFCLGCQMCLGNPREKCPHSGYIDPIYEAIMEANMLIFATPHYGATGMTAGMKNLLDHLDFFTLTVAPRKEMFGKKAFVLTTATGSAAAIKPIKNCLKNWGINRVSSVGIRMFIDKWDNMPEKKRQKQEKRLRTAARHFYKIKKKPPYLTTVFMYYINKFIIKKFVGEGAYPYEYWNENGYFKKRPF